MPCVEYADCLTGALQTAGQDVGPAVVGVDRRAGAVGNGVAERETVEAVAGASTSTPGEKDPGRDGFGVGDCRGSGDIATPDVEVCWDE